MRQKCSVTVVLCQPPWRGQSWVTQCHLPGVALSQTTLSPAVMSTAPTENVTTLTVTPVILSSTTPGCATFNTSTCEPCVPGSQYDNSKPVTVSSDVKPSSLKTVLTHNIKNKYIYLFSSPDTLLCSCCSDPGMCLFPGACLPCNRGFYQPLSGQQQCWPCNRGYYTKWVCTLC